RAPGESVGCRRADGLAIEQRQSRERVDGADILGTDAALVEDVAIVRRVLIRVTKQAPQHPGLQIAQGRERPALRLLQVAQKRYRWPAACCFERRKQRPR